MCTDPAAARNALVARTTGVGIALTLLAAALTGGVTGLLARPDPVAAEPPAVDPAGAAAPPPVLRPAPRPRRTIYVRVPAAQPAPAARTTTRAPVRSAPRPPAAPPRPARQPAVTTSSGS